MADKFEFSAECPICESYFKASTIKGSSKGTAKCPHCKTKVRVVGLMEGYFEAIEEDEDHNSEPETYGQWSKKQALGRKQSFKKTRAQSVNIREWMSESLGVVLSFITLISLFVVGNFSLRFYQVMTSDNPYLMRVYSFFVYDAFSLWNFFIFGAVGFGVFFAIYLITFKIYENAHFLISNGLCVMILAGAAFIYSDNDGFPRKRTDEEKRYTAQLKVNVLIALRDRKCDTAAKGYKEYKEYKDQFGRKISNILYHLGDCYQQQGEKVSAEQYFTRYMVIATSDDEHYEKVSAVTTGIPNGAIADKLAQFAIEVTPSDAKIRIMNIGPKYKSGISLKPGQYHIEVSKPGYSTYDQWIELPVGGLTYEVTLSKNSS